MSKRLKVLLVESDKITLSRVYLALIHREFKTEATDHMEEVQERIRRLKPSVVIMGMKEYSSLQQELQFPVIILTDSPAALSQLPQNAIVIEKPFSIETLISAIESITA